MDRKLSVKLCSLTLESILMNIPQVSANINGQNLEILLEYKSFPPGQTLFMPLEHEGHQGWLVYLFCGKFIINYQEKTISWFCCSLLYPYVQYVSNEQQRIVLQLDVLASHDNIQQWFSTGSNFSPQGTKGNVWGHFLVVTTEEGRC